MVNGLSAKVIGNGLIAKSFSDVGFIKRTLILASGVSNSKELRDSEFAREIRLVQREIEDSPGSTVVYFSTCSLVNDLASPYAEHKKRMENLVADKASEFHIFRLPQVVGVVHNLTLVSYFTKCIVEGKVINIQCGAKRNLLDVRDVARITKELVDGAIGVNSVQNIASAQSVSVIDIVNEISMILGCDAKLAYSDSGHDQRVNVDFLIRAIGNSDPVFLKCYWRKVLRKYVPLLFKS